MTPMPASPFISNSTAISPRAVESVVASKPPPVAGATAAPCYDCGYRDPCDEDCPNYIDEPSMTNGGAQGAPASAPTKNPDAGALGTEFIHEIFFYARKLMTGEIPAFVLDEAAFMAEVEETPLFLREDGYLQRREA